MAKHFPEFAFLLFLLQAVHAASNITSASKPNPSNGTQQAQLKPNSVEGDRQLQMAVVVDLVARESQLRQKLLSLQISKQLATDNLQRSTARNDAIRVERRSIAQIRQQIEAKLTKLHQQLFRYDQTIQVLRNQAANGILLVHHLRDDIFLLSRQKRQLDFALRQQGLEKWVHASVKDSVSPFVSDALVQGTVSVVEPVLDGIEKLATVNQDLSHKMSLTLHNHVPMVEKPFYSGFVTYVVLLFPTVLLTSLVLKIKRRIATLTISHFIILGNCYFLLLSAGCFVATFLASVDVLLTFRRQNLRLFDFVMALHGLLYIFHLLLHLSFAVQARSPDSIRHFALLVGVATHFFIHSYRHAMHNEDPDVHKLAYLVYSAIFAFITYELAVKSIRQLQRKEVMTLHNTSISIPQTGTTERRGVTYINKNAPSERTRHAEENVPSMILPMSLSRPAATHVVSLVGSSSSQPRASRKSLSFTFTGNTLGGFENGTSAKDL